MNYYAENGEDRLLDGIFTRPRGICVEVGVGDGIAASMTYRMEQRGWKCILVEPEPESFRRMAASRKGPMFNCAAGSKEGVMNLAVSLRYPEMSTLTAPDPHMRNFMEVIAYETTPVRVRTLDSILAEAGVVPGEDAIDYMSIDVERFELEVLRGLSLCKHRPTVLILEDLSCGKDPEVMVYLRGLGYEFYRRTGWNDWYVRKDRYGVIINMPSFRMLRRKWAILAKDASLWRREVVYRISQRIPEAIKVPLRWALGIKRPVRGGSTGGRK